MVRIGHLLDKMPAQCSGGESQRVALARTLVTNPSTFLLDEPLSSLDAKLRRELRAECDRLHEELKRTFIFVTHDQEEAMTLADRIVVMRDGEIEQVGSPMEIYSDPVSYFVADFFGSPSMNLIGGEINAMHRAGWSSARTDSRSRCRSASRTRRAGGDASASGPSTSRVRRDGRRRHRAAGPPGRAARQGHAALFRRRLGARLRCGDRRTGAGRPQARHAIGLSLAPDKILLFAPDGRRIRPRHGRASADQPGT